MTKPYSYGIINTSNEKEKIKNVCSFDSAVSRRFVPAYLWFCLASLLASPCSWNHRNRHFRYRVLVEAGSRSLDCSVASAFALYGRFKGVIKMMPYFWVDVGIIGKVIEKVNDDLFIYETVVTKERATVTAKWVKEHLM